MLICICLVATKFKSEKLEYSIDETGLAQFKFTILSFLDLNTRKHISATFVHQNKCLKAMLHWIYKFIDLFHGIANDNTIVNVN